MMVAAPFSRYGGKFYLLPTILPLLPAHTTWLELFAGAAWVTLAKDPAPVETINDLDDGVVGFYRVLRDPEQSHRLQELLALTPYSRSEFLACRTNWTTCADPVERARGWFVVARQAFSGNSSTGWAYSTMSRGGVAGAVNRWCSAIEGLPEVHTRLRGVQLECRDWRLALATWDRPETLVYVDPPYVLSTRKWEGGYAHEMTDEDHRDLVAALLTFRGRALLSGYAHAIYTPLEAAGWQRIDVPVVAHSTGSTRHTGARQQRVESLWMNYDPAEQRGQLRLMPEDEASA